MNEFEQTEFKNKQKTCNYIFSNVTVGAQAKETLEKLEDTSAIIKEFKKYSQLIDSKHDKYEKIIKTSRDITIESKRIIFLLHTIDTESKKSSLLKEAEKRLQRLISHNFKNIAEELNGEDIFLYHRAFSPGVQEFMEAFIYFNYLRSKQILFWDYYKSKLEYIISVKDGYKLPESEIKKFTLLLPEDFLLGLADATGELMRKCVNNLGSGNVEGCFETCAFVREIYCGFLEVGTFGSREMSHKVFTLKRSLLQMEMVCYNISIRGSEISRHMLGVIGDFNSPIDEND